MNVTLDHNCIIALEAVGADAPHLRQLIALHDAGEVRLRVVAVGGAEQKADGAYSEDFGEFLARLIPIGLSHVEILKPLAYCGMAFCGHAVVGGGEASALERAIQHALWPGLDFDGPAAIGLDGLNAALRNRRCDVLTMWCHIRYGGGTFVTGDGNFHKARKKQRLIELGAGRIMRPAEAVRALLPLAAAKPEAR